jgi:decaprenyl-phosphate phosphoribosyltransferase
MDVPGRGLSPTVPPMPVGERAARRDLAPARLGLALLALTRPHQWTKNAFVVAALVLTPSALTAPNAMRALLAFVAFSMAASAVYVLNDIMDRHADRLHPRKRHRPVASGAVPVPVAGLLGLALLAVSAVVSFSLSPAFAAVVLVYLLLNTAYCVRLKHVSIVDVLIVALGFVLRLQAGAVAVEVTPSAWIIIATGLLALFLALAKRRDDLVRDLDTTHRRSLDGYTKPFLDSALSVVLGALLVAYLVYTTDSSVMARLGTDKVYYTAPFVVAGVLRYLQITIVEERSGSPTRLVLSDRFLIATIAGWGATFLALIYV